MDTPHYSGYHAMRFQHCTAEREPKVASRLGVRNDVFSW